LIQTIGKRQAVAYPTTLGQITQLTDHNSTTFLITLLINIVNNRQKELV